MIEIVSLVAVFVFVFGVIGVVLYVLYACSPFSHRLNPYRDAATGRRRWESPHLDGPPRD